jgi:PleD family two-component response regulator
LKKKGGSFVEEIIEKEKKTILVVDDEQSIRELLVFNLQKEGYNTLEAMDGITPIAFAGVIIAFIRIILSQ